MTNLPEPGPETGGFTANRRKIFILGDSRTGTMTLHRYLEALGIPSIHWYVKQSNQLSPAHKHFEENWTLCQDFINNSGYVAFSDYPTRTFWAKLLEKYPDAVFILSVRKDLDTWRESMRGFFFKFDISLDIDALSKHYLQINEAIREEMRRASATFLELCIDDGVVKNSIAIKNILSIDSPLQMGWENRTAGYNNAIVSRRAQFFNPSSTDVISYVEAACRGSKAMPSERGWLFLINDANEFLQFQFGTKELAAPQMDAAKTMLKARAAQFTARNIIFRHFIIPEKSVVYREYLPLAFDGVAEAKLRVANRLAGAVPETTHYLADYLMDLKSYGLVYFRGDTHVSWLGAYFVYLYIAEQMNRAMAATGSGGKLAIAPPARLERLASQTGEYNGDLFTQMLPKHLSEFDTVWRALRNGKAFERVIHYHLKKSELSTVDVEPPEHYKMLCGERPVIVREHKNKTLPKAVIFRDSTADFLIDLLAEHFSRSVFIWCKGLIVEDIVELEKADVVLHIAAERFSWMYSQQPAFSQVNDILRAVAVRDAAKGLCG